MIFVCRDNIIRFLNDFRHITHKPFVIVRMAFLDMLNSFISDDDLVCFNRIGYTAVYLNIDSTDYLHGTALLCVKILRLVYGSLYILSTNAKLFPYREKNKGYGPIFSLKYSAQR